MERDHWADVERKRLDRERAWALLRAAERAHASGRTHRVGPLVSRLLGAAEAAGVAG